MTRDMTCMREVARPADLVTPVEPVKKARRAA